MACRTGDLVSRRVRGIVFPGKADPAVLHRLGATLVKGGAGEAGVFFLARAGAQAPFDVAVRIDHAQALAINGRRDEAVRLLEDGRQAQPDQPDLAARLGEILSDAGRHDEAERVLEAAVGAFPRHVALRLLLAAEYAGALKTEAALAELVLARALDPGNAKILANLGVLYQAVGDLDRAIDHYRQAALLDPAGKLARPNLATALLTRFDFAAGFAEFENRFGQQGIRAATTKAPRWQGEPLAGRHLLVTAEQGYGDMLQYARFLSPLAALEGEITLECPAGLERLFARIPGVTGVVTQGEPLPAADVTVPLVSLPFVRGCSAAQLGAAIPYLDVPPGIVFRFPDDDDVAPGERRLKVGLVWAGRPATGEVYLRRSLNRRRCPLAQLAPLIGVAEARFYGLQVGGAKDEIAASGLPVTDLSARLGDFADTAAAIAALDLVISVDTAAAHLAGAMGAPLWVLLAPGQTDYRWGLGQTTPWYPDARLFRADRSGWAGAVGLATAELRRMAKLHVRQGT